MMIFQSGHGVKAVKEVSLFLNIGLTTANKKPKNICDNNKDLIEYLKNDLEMQELPLEEKLNLQNFMVSLGAIPPDLARGLHLRNLCECLWC